MTATDSYTPWERAQHNADGGRRASLVQGLREAARYIEEHPELPVPLSADIHYCIPAATDKAGDDEAHRIARMLGSHVTGDDSSETSRHFGPAVQYLAVYITKARAAEYEAHMALYHTTETENLVTA